MSKPKKQHQKEVFKPKIGFDDSEVKEMTFSFSEFEIEGNPPKSNSFFSDSEKVEEENQVENNESIEAVNVSNGLNHAFFEENSDSASIKEPMKVEKELNENTEIEKIENKSNLIQKAESENSDLNEIIISKAEDSPVQEKKKKKKGKRPKDHENSSKDPVSSQNSENYLRKHEKHLKPDRKNHDKNVRDNIVKKKTCCKCSSCSIF